MPSTRMPAAELHRNLAQFTGTEQYHRIHGLLLTDGTHYLADKGFCLWLMQAIASYQGQRKVQSCRDFQLWTLTKDGEEGAVLTMQSDSGEPAIVTQKIEYTDFPFDGDEPFKLYVIDGICLLPSEY